MLATLEGVAAAGFHAVVAAPPLGPLADVLRQRGIDHVPWRVAEAAGVRPAQARLREGLTSLLAHVRPDLLHANSLSMGRLSGPVNIAAGVPGIAHLRDIVKLSRAAIADLNCHRRLLAVSQAVREFYAGNAARPLHDRDPVARSLRDRGPGARSDPPVPRTGSRSAPATLDGEIPADKLHVLYNGVDLDEFRPRPATCDLHRELGLPETALLAGTIGQIGPRKGQDVLVRTAALLAGTLPELHWLIVGERHSEKAESREFEAGLHRAAEGLPGRLRFLGRRSDVPRLLNGLAVLVHPARQEPLGRVLLEAAASGVPTVATAVGGTCEIFPPGSGSAILVPPDDPHALAEGVYRLLTEPALRPRVAAAARRRAEEAFDVRQSVAGLVGHYREVLGE